MQTGGRYLKNAVVVSDGILRDVQFEEIFDEQHEKVAEDGLTDVVVIDDATTLACTLAVSCLVVPDVHSASAVLR